MVLLDASLYGAESAQPGVVAVSVGNGTTPDDPSESEVTTLCPNCDQPASEFYANGLCTMCNVKLGDAERGK